jgi:hypothetical protein
VIDRVNQKPFLLWQAEALLEAPSGEPETPLPEDATEVGEEQVDEAKQLPARSGAAKKRPHSSCSLTCRATPRSASSSPRSIAT